MRHSPDSRGSSDAEEYEQVEGGRDDPAPEAYDRMGRPFLKNNASVDSFPCPSPTAASPTTVDKQPRIDHLFKAKGAKLPGSPTELAALSSSPTPSAGQGGEASTQASSAAGEGPPKADKRGPSPTSGTQPQKKRRRSVRLAQKHSSDDSSEKSDSEAGGR